MKQVFTLLTDVIRSNAIDAVSKADKGMQVIIAKRNRSLESNAKFHVLCEELSKQADHLGRKFSMLQWKHLLVSAHAIETKEPFEPICGLAGEFLNIRESTAKMNSARMASLIEYALCVCAEKGVIHRE